MEINKKTLKSIFWGVAGCILLYWILHETERVKSVFAVVRSILSPFIIGSVLAFIMNVPMRSIEGKLLKIKNDKFRRIVAVILTALAVLLVLALVFWLLIPQVIDTAKTFASKLPAFFGGIQKDITDFLANNPQLMQWVYDNTDFHNIDFPGIIQKVIDMVGDSVSTIVTGTFSAIGSVTGVIVDMVIGVVFALYCLFTKENLARQGRRLLYAFLPEKWCDISIRILRLTNSTFSNFLSGQCIEVLILGCMFAISMAIFRMPYIPLVSVLIAVTAFIPVVGAFAGCIFGAFFILVDNPIQAVWFVVMFLILQQIENNVIYPRVVGTSIGLPGMWVLVAVAIGGELMGVAGMFLMIPFASVIYTLIREITKARLDLRAVDENKLVAHPPELRSHLKEKGKKFKLNFLKKQGKNKK